MKRSTGVGKKSEHDAPESVAVAETKNDKQILVERTKDGRFFTIRFDTGGELPVELRGIFTSFHLCTAAIDDYLARKGLN